VAELLTGPADLAVATGGTGVGGTRAGAGVDTTAPAPGGPAGMSATSGDGTGGPADPTGRAGTGAGRRGAARRRTGCRLEQVTVRYRADGPPALDRVSLDLPPGRRVAVVGPSGAGKSTLLAVLTGAVRPDHGRVTLDGVDICERSPEELPRAVSGLLADAHVFHATVRENLLLGRGTATEDELTAAAAAAGLLDWVRRQPAGWETVVGEDGGQLSGGQRQRLVLARALLAAPTDVLVLDEPTEGLDPRAADRVLASATAHAGPTRTVLLVTHRLSGLDAYDEIVVLDSGRIVQRGSHAELIHQPGWYRDQWQRQVTTELAYPAACG
jgi:ATP-binding cassette subfamily C protein CydC